MGYRYLCYFLGFQVGPPIWHGYDARQEDTTPKQKALLISAFGCGFVIGLTVYFVCLICCCLKDAFQNLDDSEDLEANADYKAIETGTILLIDQLADVLFVKLTKVYEFVKAM